MSQLEQTATSTAIGTDLTRRQREVLAALQRIHQRHGFPPTLRELGEDVGLSSASSVHAHVKTLERLGLVEHRAGRNRTLRAVPPPEVGRDVR
ncbi:LexA family protein [Nitriliruptor alkaliphilus]|uniref:LexA family protein n=1 Tax=Nitriliruptor alkaliphilus TaxID=427918 RepID=UPI000695FD7E|nr:helix-turn-helix domain-containing protein [Nitriliruptor alkaliphilus]